MIVADRRTGIFACRDESSCSGPSFLLQASGISSTRAPLLHGQRDRAVSGGQAPAPESFELRPAVLVPDFGKAKYKLRGSKEQIWPRDVDV